MWNGPSKKSIELGCNEKVQDQGEYREYVWAFDGGYACVGRCSLQVISGQRDKFLYAYMCYGDHASTYHILQPHPLYTRMHYGCQLDRIQLVTDTIQSEHTMAQFGLAHLVKKVLDAYALTRIRPSGTDRNGPRCIKRNVERERVGFRIGNVQKTLVVPFA